jgi:Cu2+-exporting ATPase
MRQVESFSGAKPVGFVESEANARSLKTCQHCGLGVPEHRQDSLFCCLGCQTVYRILQERQWTHYYDLKHRDRPLRSPQPVQLSQQSYEYLDEASFKQQYGIRVSDAPDADWTMEFYLEGVHCSACVWLTEGLAEWIPGVRSIRLNLGSSVATVQVEARAALAPVAQEFQKLGYLPHPVRRDEGRVLQEQENRLLLARMGVAGACSGNTLLLALSLYAGATGDLARQFEWVSFLLYLPVLFFSAVPFFKSAWGALRTRQASMDLPVAFGLGVGSLVSIANVFSGNPELYFDSLSALIFLLLCTRYLLRRTQQAALLESHWMYFLWPAWVRRVQPESGQLERVSINAIHPRDRIQVWPGETFAVDGQVVAGQTQINPALLTGESRSQSLQVGDRVFAGTVNVEAPIDIQVEASGQATRLGALLKAMEQSLTQKSQLFSFSDRLSRGFVAATLVLALGVFLWGVFLAPVEGMADFFHRAFTVAIVACPCAFALATPLAFSLSLGRLARAGVLVKGAAVLERLAGIQTLFLDKTGTLIQGDPQVLAWEALTEQEPAELKQVVWALERKSRHPLALAICRHLESCTELPPEAPLGVEGFSEKWGQGVSGRVGGVCYRVGRLDSSVSWDTPPQGSCGLASDQKQWISSVGVYRGPDLVAKIHFGMKLFPGVEVELRRLRSLGFSPFLLSGDHPAPTQALAKSLGIAPEQCFSAVSPEEKGAILRAHPHALMVGDGANDALALAAADVGIAVRGAVEVSLQASDVYLRQDGLGSISLLVGVAQETVKVIRRNFFISLIYNFSAGTAALLGQISPLFAAVLMPASAFLLLLSSLWGTSKMRAYFGWQSPRVSSGVRS